MVAAIAAALTAVAATAAFAGAAAAASTICGTGTYAYAGLGSRIPVAGISATIAPTAPLHVRDGHVAGWIGVASPDADSDGSGGWLQVGLSAFPGDSASRLYYEVAIPGQKTSYHELAATVRSGEAHRFAVTEIPALRDWWQASIDGVPVGMPVHLPGSDRRWRAQALGESWAGETSGACNDYGYSFEAVSVRSAGASQWAPVLRADLFQDPGYVLMRSSPTSFVAASALSYASMATRTP